jgi:tRNA1Val (adenine37-N6)-methyltransferase
MDKYPFRFKQFAVTQGRCAMKVNTDGVLLGAWAHIKGADTILDIGTGTGVIALMMAQKNGTADIDAIDIDEEAFTQSTMNFNATVWADRLHPHHMSLQRFSAPIKYDVIISNPPYFINDYASEDHRSNVAKHGTELTYEDLVAGICRLMNDNGKAFLVLPYFNVPVFETIAAKGNLFITKRADVVAVTGKKCYVTLLQLEKTTKAYTIDTIQIQNPDNTFTEQYKSITKEFYLKF